MGTVEGSGRGARCIVCRDPRLGDSRLVSELCSSLFPDCDKCGAGGGIGEGVRGGRVGAEGTDGWHSGREVHNRPSQTPPSSPSHPPNNGQTGEVRIPGTPTLPTPTPLLHTPSQPSPSPSPLPDRVTSGHSEKNTTRGHATRAGAGRNRISHSLRAEKPPANRVKMGKKWKDKRRRRGHTKWPKKPR